MKPLMLAALFFAAFSTVSLHAAQAAADKDPLAKFSDEDLSDPGFCFNQFSAAIKAKDAVLAKAFIQELPRALAILDIKKDADKAKFLAALSKYEGCTATGSQKNAFTRTGEVTFSDAKGAEKKVRMQNIGGRWLVLPD